MLCKKIFTFGLLGREVHERVPKRYSELPFPISLVFGQHILAAIGKIINGLVGSCSRGISAGLVEALGTFRVPHFRFGAVELGAGISALGVEFLAKVMGPWARIFPNSGPFVEVFLGDRPHCPLGARVDSKFVVSACAWELDAVQLNIAARGGFLTYLDPYIAANMAGAASDMFLIGVHKGVNLVVVGRR